MSINDEEVFSILAQIDSELDTFSTIVKTVHSEAERENKALNGKSTPIRTLTTKMEEQIVKIEKLGELMAEVKSFLKGYNEQAHEADDASMFNAD